MTSEITSEMAAKSTPAKKGGRKRKVKTTGANEQAVEPEPTTPPLKLVADEQPAEGEPEPAPKPKRQKRAQAPVHAADATQAPESSTETTAPAGARGECQARNERVSAGSADVMTLGTLAERFLASLEAEGNSDSTIGAYRADLGIAARVLGADTVIDSILPADVERFNASDAVLLSKSGAPKAGPTVERTRRVLRLALDHAEAEGWIRVSPCGCEVTEIDS